MPDVDWERGGVTDGNGRVVLQRNFMNDFSEFGFTQLIREATNKRGKTYGLVLVNFDWVLLNLSSVIQPGLSDHYLIEFES